MTPSQLDALFVTQLGADTKFSTVTAAPIEATRAPLAAALVGALQLGEGEWFPVSRVALSKTVTGYVAATRKGTTTLVLVERASQKTTGAYVVADVSRLDGAYEKTTAARLTVTRATAELVISTFTRDFEFEDPAVPGTKNTTGGRTLRYQLKGATFELVAERRDE
jgi:hypothetical protein